MAGRPLDYDLSLVFLTINGTIITGFADGDAIKVAMDSNTFDDMVGADGEVTRHTTNDKRGTLTIRLNYGSLSNVVIQILASLDESLGLGTANIAVIDAKGGSLVRSPYSWIQKRPDLTLGKAPGPVEWVWRGSEVDTTYAALLTAGGL